MTYVINKYNGDALVSIPDRTINTNATSIKLPGRDLPRYGEPVVENLVWMLEHFAGASAPSNPIQGQIWYDTQSQSIRVYNGSLWGGTGKVIAGTTPPDSPENGQLWYHTAKKQLWAYDTGSWILVGPQGAFNSDDGVVPLTNRTSVDTTQVQDTGTALHHIQRINVSGVTVAIVSRDPEFTPSPLIPGFATIAPGITLNSSIAGNKFRGTATQADSAITADNLGGVASTVFMRRDQTNLPTTNNSFNLGSSGARFNTVFATTFNGTATSALYADVAERYHADEPLSVGTVVSLGGVNEITRSTGPGNSDVLGVISTAPALGMNAEAGSDETHPYVALLGRVPTWVKGPVKKGERVMVSDTPGVAQAWHPDQGVLAIVGRSLVDLDTSEPTLIEVVIGTR